MDLQTAVWIVVNLVGAVCVNLGQNLMKLGHNKRKAIDLPELDKPSIKRIREWQVGVTIMVGGGIANFVSFGFAPQSLLSALGSIQFVSNVFFAGFVLKERVSLRVVFATACIVAGCILIVVFGGSVQEVLTVPELMSYYQSFAYIAYLVIAFALMVGFYTLYRLGKRAKAKGEEEGAVVPAFWDRLLPVSFAMFCAPVGTQSVLFSKTLSILLRATVAGDSQLGYWFTYVVLLAFIITAVFWVTRLNKSLKLFPAMVIVPTMQIGWTIFSIISGGIYFQEFQVRPQNPPPPARILLSLEASAALGLVFARLCSTPQIPSSSSPGPPASYLLALCSLPRFMSFPLRCCFVHIPCRTSAPLPAPFPWGFGTAHFSVPLIVSSSPPSAVIPAGFATLSLLSFVRPVTFFGTPRIFSLAPTFSVIDLAGADTPPPRTTHPRHVPFTGTDRLFRFGCPLPCTCGCHSIPSQARCPHTRD